MAHEYWPTRSGVPCCVDCGATERAHRSFGLCRRCLAERQQSGTPLPQQARYYASRLEMWAPRAGYTACVDCGTTERPHKAHGRCSTCAYRLWIQAHPDARGERNTPRCKYPLRRGSDPYLMGDPTPARQAAAARLVAVAREVYGLTPEDWESRRRHGAGAKHGAHGRQVVAFLLAYWCGYSCIQVAAEIRRDRTTAMYGIGRVERALLAGESNTRDEIGRIFERWSDEARPSGGEDAEVLALVRTIRAEVRPAPAPVAAPAKKSPLDMYWAKRDAEKARQGDLSWAS